MSAASEQVLESKRIASARYRAERVSPETPDERRERCAWIEATLRELSPDGVGRAQITSMIRSAAAARWSEGRLYALAVSQGCDGYHLRAGAYQAELVRRLLGSAAALVQSIRAIRAAAARDAAADLPPVPVEPEAPEAPEARTPTGR